MQHSINNISILVSRNGNLLFTQDGNTVISPVGNKITMFDLKNHRSQTLPVGKTCYSWFWVIDIGYMWIYWQGKICRQFSLLINVILLEIFFFNFLNLTTKHIKIQWHGFIIEARFSYTLLALSPTGTSLVALQEDGEVHLISMISKTILHRY